MRFWGRVAAPVGQTRSPVGDTAQTKLVHGSVDLTTQPIEREWMRELMVPEVELGVVTPAELNALAGTRSTLRSYIRTQPSPRTAEHVLEAENDLAHQIARDGGAETAAVQRARALRSRVRAASELWTAAAATACAHSPQSRGLLDLNAVVDGSKRRRSRSDAE